MTRVVTVVQARTGSTRLPHKVLLPLLGEPALCRMVDRLRRSRLAGTVVVATTWLPEDDVLAELCDLERVACYRGHPTDLLDRHHRVGVLYDADLVVKVPSDCPLIDPAIVDRVLSVALSHPEIDYVSNLHPATWPDGNDVEAVRRAALARAFRHASRPIDREHTTPYLWDNHDAFRIANVERESGPDVSATHRVVLDYPDDYRLISQVFEELYPDDPHFDVDAIVRLLDSRPELRALNAAFHGTSWMSAHRDELRTGTPSVRARVPAPREAAPFAAEVLS